MDHNNLNNLRAFFQLQGKTLKSKVSWRRGVVA